MIRGNAYKLRIKALLLIHVRRRCAAGQRTSRHTTCIIPRSPSVMGIPSAAARLLPLPSFRGNVI